ncbi:MAG: hypothetical protein QF415_01690 [Candidatus Undinarchaeales archaeon]|nr:hypothetical protein [Candidatus Undinarchaeales archaeon]MDP7493419.1 hypothetical protein [Candidatus Undinarchaeales archaeon]
MAVRRDLAAALLVVLLAIPYHAGTLTDLRANALELTPADEDLMSAPPRWENGTILIESPMRRYPSTRIYLIIRSWYVYTPDTVSYLEATEMVCSGRFDWHHYRVPFILFPLTVAPLYCPTRSLNAMVAINLALMAGTFFLVWRILGRLGLGRPARTAVLGWMVLSPLPLRGFTLMSESVNLFFYFLVLDRFIAYEAEGARHRQGLIVAASLFLLGRPTNVILYLSLFLFRTLRSRPFDVRLLWPILVLLPVLPAVTTNIEHAKSLDLMYRGCEGYLPCFARHFHRGLAEVGASSAVEQFLPATVAQTMYITGLPALLVLAIIVVRQGLRQAFLTGPLALLAFQLAAVVLYMPLAGHYIGYRHVIFGTPLLMGLIAGLVSPPSPDDRDQQ